MCSNNAPTRILTGKDIICLASSDWASPQWVNAQHVMSRLADAGNRILYVDSIGLRPPSVGKRDLAKVFRRLKRTFCGWHQARNNVWVYSPAVLPWYNYCIMQKFNVWTLRRHIRRYARKLGFANPILWTLLPTAEALAGTLNEQLVVYHCVDEYAANPGVPAEWIRASEARLLGQADLVFATSRGLRDKCAKLNRKTVYVRNVADAAHFRTAQDETVAVPDELAAIARPRIGYVGNVSGYKVDLTLLGETARRRPDWSLVLVGPVGVGDPATDISELLILDNVHVLGPRPYQELPAFLKGLDVCLVPFRRDDTADHSFPLKFYEYVAAGKPVVSTNIDSLREVCDEKLVRIAATSDDFVQTIAAALEEEQTDALKQHRLACAQANTWEVRLAQMTEQIEKALGNGQDRRQG